MSVIQFDRKHTRPCPGTGADPFDPERAIRTSRFRCPRCFKRVTLTHGVVSRHGYKVRVA